MPRMKRKLAGCGLLTLFFCATVFCQSPPLKQKTHPAEYTFEVERQYPHDQDAFTQGFTFYKGFFYEGTGRTGQSSLRKVDPESGRVLQRVDLAPELFGEGIAILGDRIFQLTWQSHIGLVYDLRSFHQVQTFKYAGEGWGLTTDGHDLFMSDGTAEIRVLDPNTFGEKRHIKVRDGGKPIDQLNELEFVEGEIFANIWHSDRIARISAKTGEVVGWIDLAGLLGPFYKRQTEEVLNGIAYDSDKKRLYVTGKLWPKIFQIRIVPKNTH